MIKAKLTTNFKSVVGQYWSGTPGADLPPARGRVHVAEIPGLVNATVSAVLAQAADDMAKYAKANHPWQNRTGKAEEGLVGYHGAYGGAFSQAGEVTFYGAVKHGDDVPYGVWLEVKHGGRWGIIQRTMEVFSGQIKARLEAALNDVVGG